MAPPLLSIHMHRVGPAAFQIDGGTGGSLIVDGSPDIGGEGRGMRPMELLLGAIASCASMDVVHILNKQREPLGDLKVRAEGERKDATPAPFTQVRLHFVAQSKPGERALDAHKVERAVQLGVEKYCSVAESLHPDVKVTWSSEVVPPEAAL